MTQSGFVCISLDESSKIHWNCSLVLCSDAFTNLLETDAAGVGKEASTVSWCSFSFMRQVANAGNQEVSNCNRDHQLLERASERGKVMEQILHKFVSVAGSWNLLASTPPLGIFFASLRWHVLLLHLFACTE